MYSAPNKALVMDCQLEKENFCLESSRNFYIESTGQSEDMRPFVSWE